MQALQHTLRSAGRYLLVCAKWVALAVLAGCLTGPLGGAFGLTSFFNALRGGSAMGSALFAASVNLLIVPVSLYSAGIVGIAQILRTVLSPLLPFGAQFDIAGIIKPWQYLPGYHLCLPEI